MKDLFNRSAVTNTSVGNLVSISRLRKSNRHNKCPQLPSLKRCQVGLSGLAALVDRE